MNYAASESNTLSKSETTTAESINESIDSTVESNESITVQTFRFKFSQDFTEPMSYFAKIHQFDDRIIFKEAWLEWTNRDEITSLINDEIKKLTNQGYSGDVMDKMFKSARYYYRTKKEPKEPLNPRKVYVGFSSNMLEIIDNHIKARFLENTKKNKQNMIITNISPAHAYADFVETHQAEIAVETLYLGLDNTDIENVSNKFKKTYKNRYFIQSKLITNYSDV